MLRFLPQLHKNAHCKVMKLLLMIKKYTNLIPRLRKDFSRFVAREADARQNFKSTKDRHLPLLKVSKVRFSMQVIKMRSIGLKIRSQRMSLVFTSELMLKRTKKVFPSLKDRKKQS